MKIKTLLFQTTVFILLSSSTYAQYELGWYKIKPQLGIWFGPATPFPGTRLSKFINTNLGGGLFFRINFPSDDFRSEIGSSISYYTSRQNERLISVPSYGAISYILPIELALQMQVKAGVGANYFKNKPENSHNAHPLLYLGYEMSFPAGKLVNIGLRIDYTLAFESRLKSPIENPDFKVHNGHFVNFGLMLNFNLNPN